MARGCVEDQPQRVQGSESFGNSSVLRLVEDDTAAPRDFQNTLLELVEARRRQGGDAFIIVTRGTEA